MSKLASVRLVEKYLAENPKEILAAASVTGLWLSINAAILKDLLALGLERRALEADVLSPLELAAAVDAEAAVDARDCPTGEANAPHTAAHSDFAGDPGSGAGEGQGQADKPSFKGDSSCR
jgi:hypothetical protein